MPGFTNASRPTSENRVYPWIQPGDLRADLIERCRRYVRINKPRHPWGNMQDIDLIKSAQLYQPHPETGKMGVTLAGVMLLGTDDLILKVCPASAKRSLTCGAILGK